MLMMKTTKIKMSMIKMPCQTNNRKTRNIPIELINKSNQKQNEKKQQRMNHSLVKQTQTQHPKATSRQEQPVSKTLTPEIQCFQMRQMNQRWRKRNATFRADAVGCNMWGMEREEWWRRPQSNQKQNEKKQQRMNHSLPSKTNTNSAPKSNVTTRTAGIKNTYTRDPVFSNETDEPKMTKAQCNLQSRCRCLQRVRDGEWAEEEEAVVVVLLLQANHAEAEGWCGARTVENEGLKLAEHGYRCCYLLHRGAINALAPKVQEDDVGAGLQPAHQLHQLIARQLPEAFLFNV
jgi:hypothetical protein